MQSVTSKRRHRFASRTYELTHTNTSASWLISFLECKRTRARALLPAASKLFVISTLRAPFNLPATNTTHTHTCAFRRKLLGDSSEVWTICGTHIHTDTGGSFGCIHSNVPQESHLSNTDEFWDLRCMQLFGHDVAWRKIRRIYEWLNGWWLYSRVNVAEYNFLERKTSRSARMRLHSLEAFYIPVCFACIHKDRMKNLFFKPHRLVRFTRATCVNCGLSRELWKGSILNKHPIENNSDVYRLHTEKRTITHLLELNVRLNLRAKTHWCRFEDYAFVICKFCAVCQVHVLMLYASLSIEENYEICIGSY